MANTVEIHYGRRQRVDGKQGREEIVPTELDGLSRVRVFDPGSEQPTEIYIEDSLGVSFADMPDVKDAHSQNGHGKLPV